MSSGKRKEFLNADILGGGAGVPQKRGFRPVSTEYIDPPTYDARYFETFPTAWASAYAFRKLLKGDAAVEQPVGATEEWLSLFLLHYFGIVHLAEYSQKVLEDNYDKDLWLALSGTYPVSKQSAVSKQAGLASVKLLETNNHTVVGAYYPDVIFFPSRGRASWTDDKMLQAYLMGTRLSWELCSREKLIGEKNEKKKNEFHAHLRRVTDRLEGKESKTLKDWLSKFCDRTFGTQVDRAGSLDPDPINWSVLGDMPLPREEYLNNYPLKQKNAAGGYTYYLVSEMRETTSWMTEALEGGVSPYAYRGKTGGKEITVPFRGKPFTFRVNDEDEIVLLNDLFLDLPYWCKVSRSLDSYTSRIKSLHKVDLRDPVLKQEEFAVCLAPIKRKFLVEFPQTFNVKVRVSPDMQRPAVEWTIPVLNQEVKWHITPMNQMEMPKTSLALWPPKVSPGWQLYTAYGTGSKEACGRWHLVDETGAAGTPIPLEDEEYISVLQASGHSNIPKALMFSDNNDGERGILFLSDLARQEVETTNQATLSVDFGTSNTCLAYKKDESAILKFSLKPMMLWGDEPRRESPGFVPFDWGGGKGFYPTILLARKSDSRLAEVKPEDIKDEHLFKVDIPGLHSKMEERLFAGDLSTGWETHSNLKWDLHIPTPWRSLFLGLTLMYAHADLFFREKEKGAVINKYVFTFPLAFSDSDIDQFHKEAKEAIRKIRRLCYGEEPDADPDADKFHYVRGVDESTAIARAERKTSTARTMEVFVDVGGGTADIAIRSGGKFLVLDSIKVAGNTFFRFADKNFEMKLEGASEFKKHLTRVLGGVSDVEMDKRNLSFDLRTVYSLKIHSLTDDEFKKREAKVLNDGMGSVSYQRYRTQMFFDHILAYALLQACAAAVDNQVTLHDDSGIELILGGNAWGLMLFAELKRSSKELKQRAVGILQLVKDHLAESVTDEERPYLDSLQVFRVDLLNEENLSKAKTDVARGALNAEAGGQLVNRMSYTGITLKDLKINELKSATIRWRDRWGFEELKATKFPSMPQINSASFERPQGIRKPLDKVLAIFTCLGNTSSDDQDNMPGETWRDINAELSENVTQLKGKRLGASPINHFMSKVLYAEDEQRDYLDTLAEENGQYKDDRR